MTLMTVGPRSKYVSSGLTVRLVVTTGISTDFVEDLVMVFVVGGTLPTTGSVAVFVITVSVVRVAVVGWGTAVAVPFGLKEKDAERTVVRTTWVASLMTVGCTDVKVSPGMMVVVTTGTTVVLVEDEVMVNVCVVSGTMMVMMTFVVMEETQTVDVPQGARVTAMSTLWPPFSCSACAERKMD